MTKEVLKLALEALEGADNIDVDMQAAIVKCKEALAQPAQREWVGLTGEDFSSIKFPAEMRFPAEFRAGARWAEAKLKEKNT